MRTTKDAQLWNQNMHEASFSVIGKEGSTNDGEGFIQPCGPEANSHFDEIAGLARKMTRQYPRHLGSMSDFSRSYMPWENFRKAFILPAPKSWIMLNRLRAGPNGQHRL
jgi:hypothetical protein